MLPPASRLLPLPVDSFTSSAISGFHREIFGDDAVTLCSPILMFREYVREKREGRRDDSKRMELYFFFPKKTRSSWKEKKNYSDEHLFPSLSPSGWMLSSPVLR
jgi:hypothetical protein